SPAVKAGEETVKEVSDRSNERAIGAAPDMEEREELLGLLTNTSIFVGVSILIIGGLLGVGFDALTDGETGLLLARVVGVALSAPLNALGAVWAVRWAVARRDLARRRQTPSPASQPGVRDLAYAAPLAALFGTFLALV
ncbi:hypothetical protein, partial [Cellulomonas bogoriensis]|uniref:hypothetical protein n=1 Tax=Cellulomonas bogoriensis TaxID=301388 RepID=UPI001E28A871